MAVLGFFIDISSTDNYYFEPIASAAEGLEYEDVEEATANVSGFNLQSFIAPSLTAGTYARYKFVLFYIASRKMYE